MVLVDHFYIGGDKYVAKGVDGEGIEHDLYGTDSVTAAIRIRVWASCWGIRQFQQIGGVGVTQWRELRRLDKITDQSLQWVEDIRLAADESNWCRYTALMGGVFCKRDEQLIRPLYAHKKQQLEVNNSNKSRDTTKDETVQQPKVNSVCFTTHSGIAAINPEITEIHSGLVPKIPEKRTETNPAMTEIGSGMITKNSAIFTESTVNHSLNPNTSTELLKTNKYGDEFMTQLKGIVCLGFEIITRVHEWTLSHSHAGGEKCSNLEFCQ